VVWRGMPQLVYVNPIPIFNLAPVQTTILASLLCQIPSLIKCMPGDFEMWQVMSPYKFMNKTHYLSTEDLNFFFID
jgi:hypothetical protein